MFFDVINSFLSLISSRSIVMVLALFIPLFVVFLTYGVIFRLVRRIFPQDTMLVINIITVPLAIIAIMIVGHLALGFSVFKFFFFVIAYFIQFLGEIF